MARTKGARGKKRANNYDVVVSEPQILVNETENTSTETIVESADTGSAENVAEPAASSETLQQQYADVLNQFDNVIETAKSNAPEPVPGEKRGRKSKAEVAQDKIKVPGRLFALMVDRVMANGLSIIDSATNKHPETIIPAQWLMADDKTLDEMAAVASASAAELGIEEHPTITLFGLLLSNQLSQFAALKAMIRQEKKRNPDFDVMDLKPNKT